MSVCEDLKQVALELLTNMGNTPRQSRLQSCSSLLKRKHREIVLHTQTLLPSLGFHSLSHQVWATTVRGHIWAGSSLVTSQSAHSSHWAVPYAGTGQQVGAGLGLCISHLLWERQVLPQLSWRSRAHRGPAPSAASLDLCPGGRAGREDSWILPHMAPAGTSSHWFTCPCQPGGRC